MKYIKLYEAFKTPKVLYRTTVFEWLVDFLKKGVSKPLGNNKYISFSKEENSGNNDAFGDIRIDFDAAELYKQGAIEVEYTAEYFKKHSDICFYVTGFSNEEEYNESIKGPNQEKEWTWLEYINTFKNEQEVMLKIIKMKPGLIKKVTVWDADERDDIPQIKELLKTYKIKVEVPWEQN